jgi:hypothetical protein
LYELKDALNFEKLTQDQIEGEKLKTTISNLGNHGSDLAGNITNNKSN